MALDYSLVLLVNVVSPPDGLCGGHLPAELPPAISERAKRLRSDCRAITKLVPAKIKVRPVILTGQAAPDRGPGGQEKVDLIIIATHGQTGRALGQSPKNHGLTSRPVLIIPSPPKSVEPGLGWKSENCRGGSSPVNTVTPGVGGTGTFQAVQGFDRGTFETEDR
jgi:hypothetical protein